MHCPPTKSPKNRKAIGSRAKCRNAVVHTHSSRKRWSLPADFLGQADGPRVAVFDTTGWDTHANEGGAQGQLAVRLRAL
jgi:uncharacterized protein (DUF1501 family)